MPSLFKLGFLVCETCEPVNISMEQNPDQGQDQICLANTGWKVNGLSRSVNNGTAGQQVATY